MSFGRYNRIICLFVIAFSTSYAQDLSSGESKAHIERESRFVSENGSPIIIDDTITNSKSVTTSSALFDSLTENSSLDLEKKAPSNKAVVTEVNNTTKDTTNKNFAYDPKCQDIFNNKIEMKKIGEICENSSYKKRASVFPMFSIGVGIPAIAINLKTREIGFIESLSPFQFSINTLQYKYIRNDEIHDFSFWVISVGLELNKRESDSNINFGLNFVPYGIRMDKVMVGLGLKWLNNGKVDFKKESFSIIIPVTYTLF